jgi:hypothetical protein
MKRMFKFFLTIIFLSFQSAAFADAKPKKINATKTGKGPNGYDQVEQEWTGTNSGNLTCKNPGNTTCEWLSVSIGGESWDVDEAFDQIMMGEANSGTFEVNGVTVTFTVISRLPNNEGKIEFIIYE